MKKFAKGGLLFAAAVMAALLILIAWPARREAALVAMGGIPIRVVAYGRTPWQFSGDMAAVRGRVAELEATFNRYDPRSELSQINRAAAVAPVAMNPDMARVMAIARRWQRETGGAFDPSVGPLVDLWREAGRKGELPSDAAIARARALAGLGRVSAVGINRIFFARDGMALDFGAIAKGLADDLVAELLAGRGVKRGVVDAGGNALAFGAGTFTFGIQDPTAPRGTLLGTLEVPAGAIMTSGNSERFVEIDGKRSSHIVDPRTGGPVDNDLLSATVIGGTGADADALATALMVLGRGRATAFLKRLDGPYGALLVERAGDVDVVWVSKALLPRLHLQEPWASRVRTF